LAEEEVQKGLVDLLHGARVVPPVDLHLAVFHVLDGGLAAAHKKPPVQAGKPQGVHALLLEKLHQALVDQTGVDHDEDLQGPPVREAAHLAPGVGEEPGRVAQGLGHLVGLRAPPVHQKKPLALLPQGGRVLGHGLVVYALRAAYLDHDHGQAS
jgi:hypothetical protein